MPDNSTIEDLLPLSFVKYFFDKEMGEEFTLVAEKAILNQIKNQNQKLKTDKQKLDSLKIKLSNEFCKEYKTRKKIKEIKRLSDTIEALTQKIDIE